MKVLFDLGCILSKNMKQGKQNYLLKSMFSQPGGGVKMNYLDTARASSNKVTKFMDIFGHERILFGSVIS